MMDIHMGWLSNFYEIALVIWLGGLAFVGWLIWTAGKMPPGAEEEAGE